MLDSSEIGLYFLPVSWFLLLFFFPWPLGRRLAPTENNLKKIRGNKLLFVPIYGRWELKKNTPHFLDIKRILWKAIDTWGKSPKTTVVLAQMWKEIEDDQIAFYMDDLIRVLIAGGVERERIKVMEGMKTQKEIIRILSIKYPGTEVILLHGVNGARRLYFNFKQKFKRVGVVLRLDLYGLGTWVYFTSGLLKLKYWSNIGELLKKNEPCCSFKEETIFIASDLTSPLASSISSVDTLGQTSLTSSQRRILKSVRDEVLLVKEMLEDYAFSSREDYLENGNDYKEISVKGILENVERRILPSSKKKQVGLTTITHGIENLMVLTDRKRLINSLLTLVHYSLIYTKLGYVKLRCVAEENGSQDKEWVMVRFEIEDSGTQFPYSALELFDRRLNRERVLEPDLLGLRTAINNIEHLGGEYGVISPLNSLNFTHPGNLIYFSIPLKVSLCSVNNGNPNNFKFHFCYGLKTVLIGESTHQRKRLKWLLEKEGLYVHEVNTVNGCISLLEKSKYNLVMIDLDELSGSISDVLHLIREQKNRNMFFIIIDSINDTWNDLSLNENGISYVIKRPFDVMEIQKALAQVSYENTKA
ncbi:hypothetical protein KZP23_02945 [Echinicola marina]|uniref:hybrid sensor histidine kinase/response regulator n=1 Tax=Echinicola marina TaxID=2859768 RepID=UPI001CF6299E|nr:hypothetical protein [Echinicola marina]UCS94005.1 hypothetical protein KZP23_02945 [Echinicola marina]